MAKSKVRPGRPRENTQTLPHPNVWCLRPQPKNRQPNWRIAWHDPDPTAPKGKDGKPRLKFDRIPLPAHIVHDANVKGTVPVEVQQAAHNKSKALGYLGGAPVQKGGSQTLYQLKAERLRAGKMKGGKGQRYAPGTERHIKRGFKELNAFALRHGVAKQQDGSVLVADLKRTVGTDSLVKAWWNDLGSKMAAGSRMALIKNVRPSLERARYIGDDRSRVFNRELLHEDLPVYQVKPEKGSPQMISPEVLRTLLRAAIAKQTAHRKNEPTILAADIALALLDGMRLAEQTYLKIKHVKFDAIARWGGRATYIELPAKMEAPNADINHAKFGKRRSVTMGPCRTFAKPISPLCTQLLRALCEGRNENEWVASYAYGRFSSSLKRLAESLGMRITAQTLRAVNANVARIMLGTEEQTKRNGHTEEVSNAYYMDPEWQNGLIATMPKSLEAALGIEAEVREIIAMVKRHPRQWGRTRRPLPNVLKRKQQDDAPNSQSQHSEESRNAPIPAAIPPLRLAAANG